MKKKQKKNIGVWIDHRKAVAVSIKNGRQTLSIFDSELEKHVRVQGGARSPEPYGPQDQTSEPRAEERYKQHLHRYYLKVLHHLKDADGIALFGPGEAKIEFKKEIAKYRGLASKIVGIETADKMTINQIVAKVKEYYSTNKY